MMGKIITLPSGLQISRDIDNDNCIIMHNPKTINRYLELREQWSNVSTLKFDCFYAFSDSQFHKGLSRIRPLKEGEQLCRGGGGLYGTKDGMQRYFQAMRECADKIKDECDPQEVYCYEYNNHEAQISWEHDNQIMEMVTSIFGKDAASKIIRLN